jgi:hypothetical protein
MSKSKTVTVEVDGMVFYVWYQIQPAEPDVGIMGPYIEMEIEDGPMGVEITDDIEDSVRSQLYWDLDL